MKATFTFVPPGGGSLDYSGIFDIPAVPRVGDCISVRRDGLIGTEDFIVRRIWWDLISPPYDEDDRGSTFVSMRSPDRPAGPSGPVGHTSKLIVECEFARGRHSSKEHLEACRAYELRGQPPKSFADD